MSVPMALVDFIPVVLFLIGGVYLQRDLYNKMSKGAFALFSAGTITVFVAGLLKAVWKLLYGIGICDYVVLNHVFFPMQTTGFVLAAAGILAMLCFKQGKGTLFAAAPPVYESKLIFVVLTVISVAVLDGCLIKIAAKRKSFPAILSFSVSFLFVMGMGYLSTKNFDGAAMNWIAELVNIVGEGTFMLGAVLLHKGGLADAEALK